MAEVKRKRMTKAEKAKQEERKKQACPAMIGDVYWTSDEDDE